MELAHLVAVIAKPMRVMGVLVRILDADMDIVIIGNNKL
jgi:hypothetical protein